MVTQETLLSAMLVFCRIGGCLLLLPGISSERIPINARLFIAIAVSLALSPLVVDDVRPLAQSGVDTLIPAIVSELSTGLLLGFFVRIFFIALEFGAIAAANFAGYGSIFSHSFENSESTSPLAMVITLPAVALFFILDQHLRVIELLQRSYIMFPPSSPFELDPTLQYITVTLGVAFRLAIQVSAPLMVFSISVNLLLGMLNKMVPQIPAYYISTPFILLGGLLVFYFLVGAMLLSFEAGVSSHISGLLPRGY